MQYEDEEIWKPVVGYEGIYEVSSYGQIRSLPRWVTRGSNGFWITGKVRKQSLKTGIGGGYLIVPLCLDGTKTWIRVHRAVAEAFCPKEDEMLNVVNHIDNNPANNHYKNLEWVTQKQNMEHSKNQGRNFKPQGELSPAAKLNYEKVRDIRKRFAQGEHYQVLADEYGVFKNTIWSIAKGDTWNYPEAFPEYYEPS